MRDDLIEDVEWLASNGIPPDQWPERLGTTTTALARRLYRYGRPDLARPVEVLRKRDWRKKVAA